MRPRRIVVDAVEVARATMASVSTPARLALWSQGECLAYTDPGLFDRVLANLLENALRHAPSGTEVVVNVARVGARTQVRVIDNGPGIPHADRARIFQPFQRQGDVPAGDGVGLGLAVARGLAESMGASVTADDTPGGGLTMTIDLPADLPRPAAAATAAAPQRAREEDSR